MSVQPSPVVNRRRPALAVAAAVLLVGACNSQSILGFLALPPCAGATATSLALSLGGYAVIDPATDSGCVALPANASATDSAEYLVVAQSAGGAPGDTAPFTLRSAKLVGPMATPTLAAWVRGTPLPARGLNALRFERSLRQWRRARPGTATAARIAALRSAGAPAPPVLGTLRSFSVCANYDCSQFKTVTATVRSVGAHVAIYVDTLAPPGGLSSAQIDSLRQVFDTHVYAVDTVAFGSVSDIDNNGVVLVLMTPVVNSLVTNAECHAGGYVAGFFYPGDLVPGSVGSNDGEIFYTIVADTAGTFSCQHFVAELETTLPTTFLHELQHLISFNQHVVLNSGSEEDLWLDEALSSYAEELGGRSFLPDSSIWALYVSNVVYDAYQDLINPGQHFLLQTSDTVLADFGAGWLYIRYLADRYGSSITNRLEATNKVGAANVAAVTGVPFDSTATRWALSNWVAAQAGFTARPPELADTAGHLPRLFALFHNLDPTDFRLAYPLVPQTASGTGVHLAGILHGGSGWYVRVLQGPGAAAFSLLFNDSTRAVAKAVAPRLDVIRVR